MLLSDMREAVKLAMQPLANSRRTLASVHGVGEHRDARGR